MADCTGLRFKKTLESRGITDADVDENSNKKQEANHNRQYYSNLLMHSEWLVDVPTNFATEWFMVPSPLGRRSLIVASERYTYCFTKNGYRKMGFQSLLPNGGGSTRRSQDETILDCIFCEKTKTFYMLDCIQWAGQQIGENEFTFRHFWLQSRVEELDLDKVSAKNQYRFVLLPKYSCDIASIEAALNTPTDYEIDGLLFYCNEAFYVPGLTPLVGWLKPFMVREILNVQHLPEKFRPPMAGPNKDHESTTAEFIEDFNAKIAAEVAKKKVSPKNSQEKMKE
uniref:Snurportin-1 n=1 Tax=Romanomermis culicivorax TaxID=13658 RepID=A0A915HQM1_ROMCU